MSDCLTTETPVTGYMVLNRDNRTSWDGEVHLDLQKAIAELLDAESNPAEYGAGWFLAEVREVVPS